MKGKPVVSRVAHLFQVTLLKAPMSVLFPYSPVISFLQRMTLVCWLRAFLRVFQTPSETAFHNQSMDLLIIESNRVWAGIMSKMPR